MTKATAGEWDSVRFLKVHEAMLCLLDATEEWDNAIELAVGAIESLTDRVWEMRKTMLRNKLNPWLPYPWHLWISERWPRKWLPRL